MFMAIDQYGQMIHGLKNPRKDLCERLGRKHVDKMYCDKGNGSSVQTGYVIGGLWLTIYKIEPWEVKV